MATQLSTARHTNGTQTANKRGNRNGLQRGSKDEQKRIVFPSSFNASYFLPSYGISLNIFYDYNSPTRRKSLTMTRLSFSLLIHSIHFFHSHCVMFYGAFVYMLSVCFHCLVITEVVCCLGCLLRPFSLPLFAFISSRTPLFFLSTASSYFISVLRENHNKHDFIIGTYPKTQHYISSF